jgi:cholesterol transport system auxiliary component
MVLKVIFSSTQEGQSANVHLMMKRLTLLITASFLSGCSFFAEDEPLPLYTLKSARIEPYDVISTPIGIELPISEASLDTERIALTPSVYERNYLADGQWPDRLPKIMQEVLVESLSTRWGGAFVTRMGSGIQVQYILQTDIQDFSVYNLSTGQPEVHLKVSFKLVNLRTRAVIGGKIFSRNELACSNTMGGIVAALNEGFQCLLSEAMPWMETSLLKESALNSRNHELGRESR